MNINEPSQNINIRDSKTRIKRFDSIGTADSPFRILLLNLFKKTTKNTAYQLEIKR